MNNPIDLPPKRVGTLLLFSFITLLFCFSLAPAPAFAEEDFAAWLASFREEAATQGISAGTLELLDDLQPIPRVIEFDRNQPETKVTAESYLKGVLSDKRVAAALLQRQEFAPILEAIGSDFGVQPRFLVALWGIESYFGTRAGDVPVLRALATLAWEGRRPFYRKELLAALQIVNEGHIDAAGMKGSWAGAMGQFQFIPTTFQRFAVDHDQDGRKDIWNNPADALASAANYLQKCGWRPEEGWGQEVSLPKRFDAKLASLKTRKTLAQWQKLGVKGIKGAKSRQASLILPDGPDGPAFLVTDNFRTLLSWNRSTYFALSVSLMADRVLAAEGKKAKLEAGSLGVIDCRKALEAIRGGSDE